MKDYVRFLKAAKIWYDRICHLSSSVYDSQADAQNMQKGHILVNIQISELARATLKLYLLEEENDQPLAFQIVPLTSGCSTPSFALELTEVREDQNVIELHGIPFVDQSRFDWLNGLVIDVDRSTGKLSIFHPNPSFPSECQWNG